MKQSVARAQIAADTVGRTQREEVPSLTGLRFIAAISVAIAHGTDLILRFDHPSVPGLHWVPQIAGFGMTLFFLLSGFVIHYNYRLTVTKGGVDGIGRFIWARFSRLYPLYAFVILLDILLGRKLYQFITGGNGDFLDLLRALPYFLTFTQSWLYVPFKDGSLIYQIGDNSALTWSISTEWFFYLSYPIIALLIFRTTRASLIGVAGLVWCAVWIILPIWLYNEQSGISAWSVHRYGTIAEFSGGNADSYFRWLMYLSPYLRIGEFILGCFVSQLYFLLEERIPSTLENLFGGVLLAAGIVSVPVMIYLMYAGPSPEIRMLNFNFGLAPSGAIILFCVARYRSTISHFLNTSPIMALGEASYSIYLFHFLILNISSSYIGGALPGSARYVAYAFGKFSFLLAFIMLISLGFHAYFEVPARRWLRRLWQDNPWRKKRMIPYGVLLTPVIAAILLSFMLPNASGSTNVSGGIDVAAATYGQNCGATHGNATTPVRQACNGRESCAYVVDVSVLGDPAPGCAKDFTADYRCTPSASRLTQIVPAEAGLKSTLVLTCRSAPR